MGNFSLSREEHSMKSRVMESMVKLYSETDRVEEAKNLEERAQEIRSKKQ